MTESGLLAAAVRTNVAAYSPDQCLHVEQACGLNVPLAASELEYELLFMTS